MKKVTHVITTISRGGAENQLLVLAREQILNDWHVSIVYLKDEPELIDAFKKTGVEVITECAKHSVIGQVFWLRNYFKKQKSVTNRAKSGIAISKAVEISLRSKNEITKNFRISVIYYGYDNSLPANENKKLNRADFGLKKNDFVFGTIGRIVPQKDYPTLLRAFSIVSRDLNDCKLLIIGDGSLRIDMHKLSNELGISDKVFWHGRTNRIAEILNLMDCFVLASLYEGFGLVLLEAMSANIPIVASNISAIPEVLGNRYPLLSIPGDPSNFAMNMSLVANLSKKERLKLLETQSIQLEKFNPNEMSIAIEKVYSEINV
ncbi:MAG: glycosyltransferase [Chitinophagia bacterium]|nr:glycosyltransferase [Chitinophagia bacterium]